MPKLKLTKTAADAAQPADKDYELRDTLIPGFMLKVTPAGRKIFMVAYVANNGRRRKPARFHLWPRKKIWPPPRTN